MQKVPEVSSATNFQFDESPSESMFDESSSKSMDLVLKTEPVKGFCAVFVPPVNQALPRLAENFDRN